MKKKKWILSPDRREEAELIRRELGLPRLASRVLAARGLGDVQEAREFMDCSPSRLHDPFLLTDMDRAVEEIQAAIENKEKIAVYGDYDVDGVTATCVLIQYLRSRGADCTYYIPDRMNEGYGLNTAAIQSIYNEGYRLLITVDSGITAVEEAEFASQLGLKLIITDHHECKEQFPSALAVVNPRRPDSCYPFRELAGVGVAFKLVCALEAGRPIEALLDAFADVVAVGTIADVMPIVGENRVIVTHGLKRLAHTRNLGLQALMDKLGLNGKPVSSNSVSFVMAPRINAAGRLGGATQAAQMFLTRDPAEAAELAERLCELNRMRQDEENKIFKEIVAELDAHPEQARGKMLVLWGDGWHNGVIGIVASRLSDRYGVPCVLISMNDGVGKGSGRSIKGFNLYAALEQNATVLDKYGGHELAVGLTVKRENLGALRAGLEACAAAVGEQEVVPCVAIDCEAQPEDLTLAEVRGLSALEPFGMGNQQPCFVMRGVRVEEITPISHDRHVKLMLSKNGKTFFAFAFGMGARSCPYVKSDFIDVAFAAEINSYRGRDSIQLVLKDTAWALEENQCDGSAWKVYRGFLQGEDIGSAGAKLLSPSRQDLVAVFRHVRSNAEQGVLTGTARTFYRRVRYESRSTMNLGRFMTCLDVFHEFSIFSYDAVGDDCVIRVLPYQGKADINGSKILKRLLDTIKSAGE